MNKAVAAADSIKPADINEAKGNRNPTDTLRFIMDAVQILFKRPLDPVKLTELKIQGQMCPFVMDSFQNCTKATLGSPNLLKDIMNFSQIEKDNINEETIELLEPYLTLKAPDGKQCFDGDAAAKASQAMKGVAIWSAAMSDYHKASKIVKPKLLLLNIKMAELDEANANLAAAETELAEVIALKAKLKATFDLNMAEKNALTERANKTKKKMEQANRLINSLEDNKIRWIANANEFKSLKIRLTGDVAKACAFVSYCGPFNAEFRGKLLNEYFHTDLINKDIPVSEGL